MNFKSDHMQLMLLVLLGACVCMGLSSDTLKVSAHTESHDMMVGEELEISFDLHPDSCHLTFFPEDDADSYELVSVGRLQDNHLFHNISLHSYLSRFVILIRNLQTSNSGRFELTDENGNLALVVNLKVMGLSNDTEEQHYEEGHMLKMRWWKRAPASPVGLQAVLIVVGIVVCVVCGAVCVPYVCHWFVYGCILLCYCCKEIFGGCIPPDNPEPDASGEGTVGPVVPVGIPHTFLKPSKSPYHEACLASYASDPPFSSTLPSWI